MEVGSRVRVVASVVVYNHPEHRNAAFDMQGQEGEIIANVTSWQGRPVSANLPLLVKFGPKHKIHLQVAELELI
jgi:hypothetical protein